ncbi:Breast cancer type 1 susceptibility protein homolog [Caenorhabditis elegans]|uniref:Breast cancer type 1 susceptibility protein homolog n=1 Tax=Caenorhabditis elegans TaxID=6239 RepID=UPI0013A83F04|nr:Breast cancer type 1 susceptibility protein homolog [Caenorhabditis elegans]CAR97812.2 Breast cancer type 1 susceptibility protein homolog [Caenorhabditis elegans]
MADVALRITETVARLQKELKCGICCSTYKDPILSTCFHIFCRSCINACFERKRKVQCPICRSVLDKRSCRDTYQITMAVQNYLKLSEAFKKDIENMNTFKSLPPEKMFMESQMPLDITIIPENDGKRCAPDFAIPFLPVRRKRPSRPQPPSAFAEEPAEPVEPPEPATKQPVELQSRVFPLEKLKKDVETSTETYKISREELKNVDIEEYINTLRENSTEIDEIDALFQLMPTMRQFLRNNINQLMEKFHVAPPKKSEKPANRRVSFASSQDLENIKIMTASESLETPPEPIQKLAQKPEVFKSTQNLIDLNLNTAVKKPVVVASDDDEVVEDSEGELQIDEDDLANVTCATSSTTLDADRTPKAIQDDEDRIDDELSQVPKTIVCSRIHNDADEVELLSDFYHKFLSNACRFAEDVNEHTTHLVMMNSEGRSISQKSTAYLYAIARKCVIVGRQWLVDCITTGLLLSEADYTITSCSSTIPVKIPPSIGSEMGWLRSRNDEHGKLFAGRRFMILRKFTMNPYFDYKQLIELVQQCGGEILSCYENLSPEKLYIIFSKHSKAIEESKNIENLYKCDVVTMEWVLDSISEYLILPTQPYKAVDSIGCLQD